MLIPLIYVRLFYFHAFCYSWFKIPRFIVYLLNLLLFGSWSFIILQYVLNIRTTGCLITQARVDWITFGFIDIKTDSNEYISLYLEEQFLWAFFCRELSSRSCPESSQILSHPKDLALISSSYFITFSRTVSSD